MRTTGCVLLIALCGTLALGQGGKPGGAGAGGGGNGGGSGAGGTQGGTGGGTSGGNGGSNTGGGSPSGAPQGGTPAPGTGGGASTPSSVYFESQTLAYGAVDRIAETIGTQVCTAIPEGTTRRVFIYDPVTFANIQVVSGFLMQLKVLTAAFQGFLDVPPGSATDVSVLQQLKALQDQVAELQKQVTALQQKSGPGVIKPKIAPGLTTAESVLTALGPYITASTADKNTNFSLSDAALAMSVTHYVKRTCPAKVQLIYPRIGLPIQDATDISSDGDMIGTLLQGLFKVQRQAALLVQATEDRYPLTAPGAGQQAGGQQAGGQPVGGQQGASQQGASQQGGGQQGGGQTSSQVQIPKTFAGGDYQSMSGATGMLNSMLQYYTQPLPNGSVPAIASLSQGYQLLNELAGDNSSVLFMEGTVAGGTQRDRKNLLTNLFSGDLLRYSGGAVIAFGVLDLTTGEINPAHTYRYMTPYTTIGKPRGSKLSRSGDNLSDPKKE